MRENELKEFSVKVGEAFAAHTLETGRPSSEALPSFNFGFLEEGSASEPIKQYTSKLVSRIEELGLNEPNEIYELPEFRLDEIPREEFDRLYSNSRRNGFGNEGGAESGWAYVAAGVVAVIGAKKVHSIISKKVADGQLDGWDPNGPPLGPDDGPVIFPPRRGGGGPVVPGQPRWTDPLPPDFESRVFQGIENALAQRLRNEIG
ncbi:hypothetical protein [Martelella sp. HB161492]|uniref:hypothetical protein n=1 Tax=Martelella sp. HB161492 TaxID=2720726 RepID=UPI0015908285|nr:hypothetical protein [Martelella sp. HB161492]